MAYSLSWQPDPGWDLTKVTCVSPQHNTDTETNPQWAQQASILQRQEEHAIPLADSCHFSKGKTEAQRWLRGIDREYLLQLH